MMIKKLAAWLGAVALCGSAQATFLYVEAPPTAGSLPGTTSVLATAQDITQSATQAIAGINGSLTSQTPQTGTPLYEIDLYRLFIPDLTAFSAFATSGNPGDDFALFLFDTSGAGVIMNDDATTDLFPRLPTGGATGPAGFYFLAISLGGVEAVDALLASVFAPGAFTDVRPGSGALLDSFVDPFAPRFGELPFDYQIALTGAFGVPEPGSVALVLVALLGLMAARRAAAGRT